LASAVRECLVFLWRSSTVKLASTAVQPTFVGGTSARSCDVPLAHSCVRLSSRVVESPHCLDTLLTWLCSQILDPPHCLQLHLCGCVRRCSTPGKAYTRVFCDCARRCSTVVSLSVLLTSTSVWGLQLLVYAVTFPEGYKAQQLIG
jgi:hypothetical protein